jgi:hypothetical protein
MTVGDCGGGNATAGSNDFRCLFVRSRPGRLRRRRIVARLGRFSGSATVNLTQAPSRSSWSRTRGLRLVRRLPPCYHQFREGA